MCSSDLGYYLWRDRAKMVLEAMVAFKNRDVQLARRIIALDAEVDARFESVKQALTRTGQLAPDRVANGVLIAKYLERISDHAVDICRRQLVEGA